MISMTLAPLNDIPGLSDRAYGAIKDAILMLTIKPGQLVNIGDLADQLGVSRTPVRDALLRLEKEGLVTINPRKGAYATPISVQDVEEIFELRILLESYATRVSAQRLTAQDIAQLEQFIQQSEDTHRLGEDIQAADTSRQLHDLLIRKACNRRLMVYLNDLDMHYTRIRRFAVSLPGRFETSHLQHQQIVFALRCGDGQKAGQAMSEHLASVRIEVLNHMDLWIPQLENGGDSKEEAV